MRQATQCSRRDQNKVKVAVWLHTLAASSFGALKAWTLAVDQMTSKTPENLSLG